MSSVQSPSSDRRFVLEGPPSGPVSSREVLRSLKCPLSGRLLRNPVLAPDGHSYDHAALDTWQDIHGHDLLPSTDKPIPHARYARNDTLRTLVREWACSQMGGVSQAHAWEWQRGLECPVAHVPMHDAVQLPDRRSYGREAAREVLQGFDKSPITFNDWQAVEALLPNHALRKLTEAVHALPALPDARVEEHTTDLPEGLVIMREAAQACMGRLMAIEQSWGGLGVLRPVWTTALNAAVVAVAQYRGTYVGLPGAAKTEGEVSQIERNAAKLEARVAMYSAVSATTLVASLPMACTLRAVGVALPGLGLWAGSAAWLGRTCLVAPAVTAVLAGAAWDPEAVGPSRRLANLLRLKPQHVGAVLGALCGAGVAGTGTGMLANVVRVPTLWSTTAVITGAAASRLLRYTWPACLAAVLPHRAYDPSSQAWRDISNRFESQAATTPRHEAGRRRQTIE